MYSFSVSWRFGGTGVHGGMESWNKSKMLPRFYEGDWENHGTISRNKDIGESYGCVFKGEKEENAFNFRSSKSEYHGTHREDI